MGDGTNNLGCMDVATGAFNVIGPLGGAVSLSDGGLDFDANSVLWGLNDTGSLFTINPATGAATLSATVMCGAGTCTGFESLRSCRPPAA